VTKLIKYLSEYEIDGESKRVVYFRAFDISGQKREDELNKEHAQEIAEYSAACDLGTASNVQTTYETVDV
jgi:hypothetical protein